MQIAKKKEKGSLDAKLDEIYSKIANEKLIKGFEEEKTVGQNKKAAKVAIAKEQMQQFQQKIGNKKAEREVGFL